MSKYETDLKNKKLYQKEYLIPFLILSFFLHSLMLGSVYFFNPSFFYYKKNESKVLPNIVRVDIVSIPKLTIKELKKIKINKPLKNQGLVEKLKKEKSQRSIATLSKKVLISVLPKENSLVEKEPIEIEKKELTDLPVTGPSQVEEIKTLLKEIRPEVIAKERFNNGEEDQEVVKTESPFEKEQIEKKELTDLPVTGPSQEEEIKEEIIAKESINNEVKDKKVVKVESPFEKKQIEKKKAKNLPFTVASQLEDIRPLLNESKPIEVPIEKAIDEKETVNKKGPKIEISFEREPLENNKKEILDRLSSNIPQTKIIITRPKKTIVVVNEKLEPGKDKSNLNNNHNKTELSQVKNSNALSSSIRLEVVKEDQLKLSKSSDNIIGKNKIIKNYEKVLVNVEPVLKRPLIEEKKGSVLDFLKALGAKKVKKVSRKKKRYSLRKIASFKMVKKNKNIIRGLIVEGNKIKKGKRFTVESTFSKDEQELRAFKKYSEKIKNSVKKFWKLPEYLKVKKNIRCRIQIFLSKDGVLLRSNVFETSGYNEYDKRALQTIKKAAPFPPMDTELIDRALRGDLIFGFPL